jgi:hypothetical protein
MNWDTHENLNLNWLIGKTYVGGQVGLGLDRILSNDLKVGGGANVNWENTSNLISMYSGITFKRLNLTLYWNLKEDGTWGDTPINVFGYRTKVENYWQLMATYNFGRFWESKSKSKGVTK